MIKFGMTVAEMIAQLTRGFTKQTGRIPSGLEKIKIQQEAIQRAKDMNKVLDMKGNPIDPAKPIMGGEQSKNLSGEITSVPNRPGQSGLSYETRNKEAIQRLKDKMKKDPPEELAYGGVAGLLGERTNYRYGGDTMGGKNDKSKTSSGPDRSRVSPQQEANHQAAMNRANDSQQYDYSGPKQIAKQVAINTAKNVGGKKLAGVLGLSQYANPIGQFMAVKSLYDKFKNTSYDEEDMTLGIVSEQQKKEIDKQANAANLMNNTGKLEPLEKTQIFNNVKPFDDKGEKNIFSADRPAEPMTQEEFNAYVKEKGYADGGIARAPFAGGGMGRRGFLKLLAGAGAGITALKSGFIGMGKKAAPIKKVAETATGSGTPPPYFFKLVEKIKMLGDDAPGLATLDRQKVTKYKDYELTEDLSTGQIDIQKKRVTDGDEVVNDQFGSNQLVEETTMSYRPSEKILLDETNPRGGVRKTNPEYDADTSFLSKDGNVYETVEGVPDNVVEDAMEEALKPGFNQGGRIGYAAGKGVTSLLNLVKKKFGRDSITTADKIATPQKTLDRDMFKKFDNRNPDPKRQMTSDELEDFEMEIGPDQLEGYDFDGTVGDAQRILKEDKAYEAEMYQQYKMGKLDPVAGDKSPARKRFLEQKLADMEASGDSRLMTRDEIEELSTFDIGVEMQTLRDGKTKSIIPKNEYAEYSKEFDQNRLLTDAEIEDYEMELGDTESWMMDGTVGEAEKALIEKKEYMADIMRMKERGDFGDFSPSKLDNVNDAQIEAAVEDVIPTGDNKLDAEMAAESLVENNPQIFGEDVLLDDLDDLTRSKIYGAVYDKLSNNMAKMIKDKRNLSSPTKTLESMKSGKGIDMSDPDIADEFTRFMKENDPKGYKDMEQKIQLESFNPKAKGRKGNAYGGRIGLLAGGGVLKKLIQNLSKEKGMSGSEVLKVMNWKSLPSEVKNLMTKEEFGRMKAQRLEGVEIWKDLMLSQQEMTKNVEAGKNTPAAGLFQELEKTSPGYGIVPRDIADEDILQMEQMIKNMNTKDNRQLNATGGIASMLGE